MCTSSNSLWTMPGTFRSPRRSLHSTASPVLLIPGNALPIRSPILDRDQLENPFCAMAAGFLSYSGTGPLQMVIQEDDEYGHLPGRRVPSNWKLFAKRLAVRNACRIQLLTLHSGRSQTIAKFCIPSRTPRGLH